MIFFREFIASLTLAALCIPAAAQPLTDMDFTVEGTCAAEGSNYTIIRVSDASYRIVNDSSHVQVAAYRDTSEATYLRIPIVSGTAPAFIAWDGKAVKILPTGVWLVFGECLFTDEPTNVTYVEPTLSNWGVNYNGVTQGVPSQVRLEQRYSRLMIATPEQAKDCMESSAGDKPKFAECMANIMMSADQREIYECYKSSDGNKAAFGFCAAKTGMDDAERQAVDKVAACYKKHGKNTGKYPLCFIGQSFDPKVATAAQCATKEIGKKGNVSGWGFAICYGGSALGANAEAQIAMECAATTGAEPNAFVLCAGGRLTAAELSKCFTHGIGGSGCFGDNNDIVLALKSLGVDLKTVLGPEGAIVKAWNTSVNDLNNGPGPNNDLVKAANNFAKDVTVGVGPSNDIVKGIDNVLPGFKNIF